MAVKSKKLKVKQVRSAIGRDDRTRGTLKALGLSRIGAEREVVSNPAILGMLSRVAHMVEVREG